MVEGGEEGVRKRVPKSMQGPLRAENETEREREWFWRRGREEYTCWILTHDDDPLRGFEACPPHACSFIFVPPRFLSIPSAVEHRLDDYRLSLHGPLSRL